MAEKETLTSQELEEVREAFDKIRVWANNIAVTVDGLYETLYGLPEGSGNFKAETFMDDVAALVKKGGPTRKGAKRKRRGDRRVTKEAGR